MTQSEPPDETTPLWIGLVMIAILVISAFMAGYVLGSRDCVAPECGAAAGGLSFEADAGTIGQ